MKAYPQAIELDEGDLQAKLDRIEAALGADIAKPFRQLLAAYITVLGLLRDKNLSILRLRKIIFGGSSERSSKIIPQTKAAQTARRNWGRKGRPIRRLKGRQQAMSRLRGRKPNRTRMTPLPRTVPPVASR